MPYFPVDDQFAFHPKAISAGNSAIGLWTRAGAWSKNHATGGHIPVDIASAIGSRSDIKRLVTVGLWAAVDGGYQFHDWEHQAGNFDAVEERARRDAKRKSDRERKRKQRERERQEREGKAPPAPAGHTGSHGVTPDGIASPPFPSPSPSSDIDLSSHLPEREGYLQDESSTPTKVALNRPVDVNAVRTAIARFCDRMPTDVQVFLISQTIIDRVSDPTLIGSWTSYVLGAVRNDWPEWQQLIDSSAVPNVR